MLSPNSRRTIENTDGRCDTQYGAEGCVCGGHGAIVRLHRSEIVVDCSGIFRSGRFLQYEHHTQGLRSFECLSHGKCTIDVAVATNIRRFDHS